MQLSVIVPAFNEAKKLEKNIILFYNYLEKQPYDFEILIINDGSTDNTLKIAERLKEKLNNLKIINNKINKGKGAAIRRGLLKARGRYRLFLDADNATSIEHLKLALPLFNNGYDVVIGSRNPKDATGAKQAVSQPAWKRLLGICGNLLIRLIAIRGIRDTQCGFKILSEEAVKKIVPKTKIDRWAFDVELLALAIYNNFKIGIIPVEWNNCPDSRVTLFGRNSYLSSIKEILHIKLNIITGKYK